MRSFAPARWNLPRSPLEKSYSFFIALPSRTASLPSWSPFAQRSSGFGSAPHPTPQMCERPRASLRRYPIPSSPSVFVVAMFLVGNRDGPGIKEDRGGAFEAHTVLPEVRRRFLRVPVKSVLHVHSSDLPG